MSYSAAAIANYFLDLAKIDGKSLNPMKIEKLVYFAHGWHLALTEEPLLDEYVGAWRYGPVIPSLYHALKHFGNGPITGHEVYTLVVQSLSGDVYVKTLLHRVWEVYGVLSAIQLSNITHFQDGPWTKAWENCSMPKGCDMDNGAIQEYFESLADAQQ